MSFSSALSGLNAAANDIAVISNNIANSSTTGFKDSRAEFADVYANSIDGLNTGSGGTTQPGTGVRVVRDTQQFTQGALQTTGNNLDMAINGGGFFTLASNPANLGAVVYSRAGSFGVNNVGMVTNAQGQALLAYKPNGTTTAAGFSTGALSTVSVPTGSGLPTATSAVNLSVNLRAGSTPIPATTTFDPTNPATYTSETSTTIYDSLGISHNLTTYYVAGAPTSASAGPPAVAASSNWTAYNDITDNPASPVSLDGGVGTPLTFNSTGQLTSTATGALSGTLPGSTAAPITATINYAGSTQLASVFGVTASTQNGAAAGILTSIAVDSSGVISANFSNGSSTPLGQVALATFNNPQGLTQLGGTNWGQSVASGAPISGVAGVGQFGQIQSGAVEQSNVNLSEQLVNLITAQQAYQANSQSISSENKMIDTILNAFR